MPFKKLILLSALGFAPGLALQAHAQAQPQSQAQAQSAPSTGGTLVVVPAFGEVKRANDEATVTFAVEEQDKDRAAASARASQKMKDGTEIVRRADPQAELKTLGYYTYPVYPELADGQRPLANPAARRVPIGWRVGQMLEVKTRNLAGLPKLAAAAQKVLNLNGVDFHLSPELAKRLDDERIAATYRNLTERIASIAHAMGRNPAEAVIDTVDFEGSGNYAAAPPPAPMMMAARSLRMDKSAEMPEPSFEPGETTLEMRLVGRVKFR